MKRTFSRTYLKTHPWLTFQLDLRRAGQKLWVALGEAQSKCEHLAGVPLKPLYDQELHKIYLAKGILASAAIEGNTLSEKEVLDRLEGKKELPPSREYLGNEIDNIIEACNGILGDITRGEERKLSPGLVKDFNKAILKGLEVSEGVVPGEYTQHPIGVGRYRGAPPEDCEFLVERFCEWLNSPDFQAQDGYEIIHGLIKAVVAHLYLVWIHPFGDGNGRTARLLEVKFLLEAGVPSVAAHLLSNHYNQTRMEYYRQLDRASGSGGDIIPFIEYAIQGFVDQLREQISFVKTQQWEISWTNYIHETLSGRSRAEIRRRKLALALSSHVGPVPIGEIRKLSPELAEEYKDKTTKTIARDLNNLHEKNLVVREAMGYRARKETILAFLPVRKRENIQENSDVRPTLPLED
ncbi:MAG: Fic family protein [Candidatus Tectomicrobia bacterium]|uniref:Fic family protein n=1 Tax=Tectimicrobiota bacterium TaxID=2528274 RepID=A0A932MNL1_UNCTE|nr:Fic family protein [Candidatus Tectomicrobia bacterium]